jgi:hypothetical protein
MEGLEECVGSITRHATLAELATDPNPGTP